MRKVLLWFLSLCSLFLVIAESKRWDIPPLAFAVQSPRLISEKIANPTAGDGDGDGDDEDLSQWVPPPIVHWDVHPMEVEAREATKQLGLSDEQHMQLGKLTTEVMEWNHKINLVSRKDCCDEVLFGRHVLPSLAFLSKLPTTYNGTLRIMDVGTGGGFPGLPLAIARPDIEFLLVDSVGKKISAVESIVKKLGLTNVRTRQGRVEELYWDYAQRHHFLLGRAVCNVEKFCFWVSDLMHVKCQILYMVGGNVHPRVADNSVSITSLQDILEKEEYNDKSIVVLNQTHAHTLAKTTGLTKQKVPHPSTIGLKKKNPPQRKENPLPKGAWAKKDNATPKKRGYENFKRYES